MLIKYLKPDFEFSDERGSLIQLFREGWTQVNYITSEGGVFRGNHYHKNNSEGFFVLSGKFELTLEDVNTGEKETHIIKEGDYFMINPYVNHSFNYIEKSALISMYDKGVEEGDKKDIYTK